MKNYRLIGKAGSARSAVLGGVPIVAMCLAIGLAGTLGGCRQERGWAVEEEPPMRLAPGEARPRTRLGAEEERSIRETGLSLAGGAEGWTAAAA